MLEPYYDEDGIVIYNADCRDVLPQLGKFDLLLTDPPYGIGEHGGACRTRGAPGYAKHKCRGWDKNRPEAEVFDAMIKMSTTSIIWGGNYFADLLPPTMGWIYWRKLMGGDFSDGELAWTSRQKALREFTKCPKGMDKAHPTEKPLGLMHWCIGLAGDVETILDPFMGSGTTLVAAKLNGCRAIGIEISREYCEIAAERLRQKVLF